MEPLISATGSLSWDFPDELISFLFMGVFYYVMREKERKESEQKIFMGLFYLCSSLKLIMLSSFGSHMQ